MDQETPQNLRQEALQNFTPSDQTRANFYQEILMEYNPAIRAKVIPENRFGLLLELCEMFSDKYGKRDRADHFYVYLGEALLNNIAVLLPGVNKEVITKSAAYSNWWDSMYSNGRALPVLEFGIIVKPGRKELCVAGIQGFGEHMDDGPEVMNSSWLFLSNGVRQALQSTMDIIKAKPDDTLPTPAGHLPFAMQKSTQIKMLY